MTCVVEVVERIAEVCADEWNEIVARTSAPIFYRHEFLSAYEHTPLLPFERSCYLIVRDDHSHAALAVLPVYVVRHGDPLGVLAGLLPTRALTEQPLVLTHIWHCYDTWLPLVQHDEHIVEVVLSVLAQIAASVEAEWYGFVNVADSTSVLPLLATRSAVSAEIETRYLLDLREIGSIDAYLETLKKSARHNLRRHHRRAQEAGIEVSWEQPPLTLLHEATELCGLSARKHANSSYYPTETLAQFVRAAGPSVRIIGIRLAGRLLAASICFLDGQRLHTWAGGADYSAGAGFSPNYVLFYEEVRLALELGCTVLEGGRRNPQFKLRHGLQPVALYACFNRVADDLALPWS